LEAEPDRPKNKEAPAVAAAQGIKKKTKRNADSTARRTGHAIGAALAIIGAADAARLAGVLSNVARSIS